MVTVNEKFSLVYRFSYNEIHHQEKLIPLNKPMYQKTMIISSFHDFRESSSQNNTEKFCNNCLESLDDCQVIEGSDRKGTCFNNDD